MRALSAAVTLAVTCAGACASAPTPKSGWGFCAPPEALSVPWREDPLPPGASRVQQAAALLGVSDELREAAAPTNEGRAARVVVLERLALTRTVLEATVAELDCERERSLQLAALLHARKERSTTRFTIASIVVGAGTAIAGGFLASADTNPTSQGLVAIAGGAVTAGLALVPLFDHPQVELEHERNVLADVWLGPRESRLFPTVVWAYLTRPEFSNGQATSIRANVVARWKEHDLQRRDVDLAALFGARGLYDAQALDLRAGMLGQVKAEVRLMNQALAPLFVGQGEDAR
jgi:riboflavin biosynthesis pyrimidine reductase